MTAAGISVKFGHVALNCLDMEITESFYVRHFGFRREREIILGDSRLVFIAAGNVVLELFVAQDGEVPLPGATGPLEPGYRHLAMEVDDLAALLAAVAGEAEITRGPLDLSQHGLSGAIAWLRDPDGRIVEVYQGSAS